MKFAFYIATGKSREAPLRDAWMTGAPNSGDQITVMTNDVVEPIDADVAVMVGMKSMELRERCKAAGQRVLTFDKGYNRKGDWWRVSIDQHQPTNYLHMIPRTRERMDATGWKPVPWRVDNPTDHVIIAGGGRKYYNTHDLPEPTEYVRQLVEGIRAAGSTRKIWYRPKPSMSECLPVSGTSFSRHKSIYDILKGAHALITFGSNACFEAMLAGVPSVVLGDAVARPISSTSLTDIEAPLLAEDGERLSLLSSLAYCQFSLREISSGSAIDEIKTQLREVVSGL